MRIMCLNGWGGTLHAALADYVGPESETLAILSRDGLTEQVTAHAEAGTRTSHYCKPMRFADYMLVNDAARVQDFRVVRSPEVSDHCPLLLTLRAA
ncbi:endonuclease/exonuclease/phosphatase family protein [Pseudooceanicola nanhaiensis]|uniref:endonuclease/exonuclease/phosphatase family protein n=1 Tax=Pseudooceanicola nanhaiensis TaxID=375761 RepID=UPI0035156B69